MGAWNLHTLTHERGDALDFFLLYSSISSVLGSVGQGNYAAANAYLDALAALRQAQGLPALSINWGPWSDVGMFAALSAHDRQRRLAQGMQTISAMPGAQLLSRLLPEHAAQRVALPIDWRKYDASSPLLAEIKRDLKPIATAPTAAPAADVLTRLQAAPPNQRRALLLGYVREQSIKVLGLSASHAINPRQPLRELGLDSLMAVELRNALGAGLQRSLPATLLFDYPALDTLTDFLTQELWPGEPPPAQSDDAEPPATATQAADLIDLSEEEAEALLLQELAAGKRGRRHD
jgi:polyketide synthase 12/myxalamid-type polyketide synthase MxaB